MRTETVNGVTLPIPEPDDFDTFDSGETFKLSEEEDGDRLYGYGHVSEEDFLAEADRYLEHMGCEPTGGGPVIHVYAKFDADGERFHWKGVTPDDPHSWPLTILYS